MTARTGPPKPKGTKPEPAMRALEASAATPEKITNGRTGKGQFAKGVSGNPQGRPLGCKSKLARAVHEALDAQRDVLIAALIDRASDGHVEALRLVMERMAPSPKHPPRSAFEIGPVETMADALAVQRRLVIAVAAGQIEEDHAAALGAQLAQMVKMHETSELEAKVAAIAKHLGMTDLKIGSSIKSC